MKRYLTEDDYIISFEELLEANELEQSEIDGISKMSVGDCWSFGVAGVLMRITDGEHLSSHDEKPEPKYIQMSGRGLRDYQEVIVKNLLDSDDLTIELAIGIGKPKQGGTE